MGHKHISKKSRTNEKLKSNGAASTDEFRERFELHRSHSNIQTPVDGRRRPKKGPGPDLTKKGPFCDRFSVRNVTFSEARQKRVQEGVQPRGPNTAPGTLPTRRSKKSDRVHNTTAITTTTTTTTTTTQ